MDNSTHRNATAHNSQSGQEVAKHKIPKNPQRTHLSKNHRDYWKSRLERHTYTRDGKSYEVAEYSVRVQHLGRRKSFALGLNNAELAADKAAKIYMTVLTKGWGAAIEEFNPAMVVRSDSPALGDFLKAARMSSGLKPRTFKGYASCLRNIVADVFKLEGDERKYDYKNGGNKKWVSQVEAVRLSELTPDRVHQWKLNFLKRAGSDPLAQKRAQGNVNSIMRSAKSLFAPKVTRFLAGIRLPSPLPFDGVEFEKTGSTRYKSMIDPASLYQAAMSKLAIEYPEQFKIFMLSLAAGLRKAEIDTLLKRQIDFVKSQIWIGLTKSFHPKTKDSEGLVDVDPVLLAELRPLIDKSPGEFVIASDLPARPDAMFRYYRCEHHFKQLNAWLRSEGVTVRKPVHELRKEFGSLICQKGGIYAASSQLRHASITITANHYLDRKARTTVRIADFLPKSNPVVATAAA